MRELTTFTRDFRDGSGPITYYGRRMNLNEAITIESHKKFVVTFDDDGNKVQTVSNAAEWLMHMFLTLAKDEAGQRMFGRAADADRVRTAFNPKAVFDAAIELQDLEDDPGN